MYWDPAEKPGIEGKKVLKRRRRNKYKFTEKTHSKKAITSGIMALVSLIVYLVFLRLASGSYGGLSMYYGSMGIFAMVLAIVALVLSISSLFEEDSFKNIPRVSTVVSILALICWVGTYIKGFL